MQNSCSLLSFLNLNSRNSQNQDVVHSLNEHSPTLLHNQKAISIIIMANNLVADSDLRAVLQAIDNKLQEFCKEEMELHKMMQKASVSLQQNLNNIVTAIPSDEYGVYTRENPLVEEEEEEIEEEDSVLSEDSIEYDEEELLDLDALERARGLRCQVREAAARVVRIRQDTTSKAVELAHRKVSLIVGENDSSPTAFDVEAFQARLNETDCTEEHEELRRAFNSLSRALEEMEFEIPQKSEALRTTVETIEEGLIKQKSISRTEQAIVSKENEGLANAPVNEMSEMNGEQRLARFLGQY